RYVSFASCRALPESTRAAYRHSSGHSFSDRERPRPPGRGAREGARELSNAIPPCWSSRDGKIIFKLRHKLAPRVRYLRHYGGPSRQTSGRRQQLRDSRLKRKQRALSIEPARITREAAVRSDDSVARNDDADRIAPGRGARGARAARASGAARELAVGDGLAEADRGDRLPHGQLKRRAFRCERGFEALALAAEVFGELLFRLAKRRVACIPPPIRVNLRKIFLAVEVDAGEPFLVCDEQHPTLGAFIEIVVVHCLLL